jgi:hypothetical protein
MHSDTKRRIKQFLKTIAIATLILIVLASGLCWIFFETQLDNFLTFAGTHSKVISILAKSIVFISGIIWVATPIAIVCCIYTLTKEHRNHKKPAINTFLKPVIQRSKWLSTLIGQRKFNPDFNFTDVDHFMKNELKNLRDDLTERRDEYLSMYHNGPLFLTEARDRLRNKMSVLLDYQDEVILYMHAELQVKIAGKIRYYRALMKDRLQDIETPKDQSNYYSDELGDYYTEIHTAFSKKIADLNIQVQALSDDHVDALQNLSKTFSQN